MSGCPSLLTSPSASGYGLGPTANGSLEPSEVATPVAERDRYIIVSIVDGDEIEFAVAVQITHCQTMRVRVLALPSSRSENWPPMVRPPLPSPRSIVTP